LLPSFRIFGRSEAQIRHKTRLNRPCCILIGVKSLSKNTLNPPASADRRRQPAYAPKTLFHDFIHSARESLCIGTQLGDIEELNVDFIQRRGKTFLPAEVNPVQKDLFGFTDSPGATWAPAPQNNRFCASSRRGTPNARRGHASYAP